MNDHIVFSTEKGRIKEQLKYEIPKSDGVIRIWLHTSGRKGKGVAVVTGLELQPEELNKLAAELKKRCGCGGTVKDNNIEIQGDKRDRLKVLLEDKGYKVKLAGG